MSSALPPNLWMDEMRKKYSESDGYQVAGSTTSESHPVVIKMGSVIESYRGYYFQATGTALDSSDQQADWLLDGALGAAKLIGRGLSKAGNKKPTVKKKGLFGWFFSTWLGRLIKFLLKIVLIIGFIFWVLGMFVFNKKSTTTQPQQQITQHASQMDISKPK